LATEESIRPLALREALTSSIRYWEPRRLVYNAALILIVIGAFVAGWPGSKDAIHVETVLFAFVLAVLANVVYCAAYVPDLFMQYSSFRQTWLRGRWVLCSSARSSTS
jgi:drug/metabolite transporter (DMT)-like permease